MFALIPGRHQVVHRRAARQVARPRVPGEPVLAVRPGEGGQLVVRRRQRAALAAGEVLRRVERVAGTDRALATDPAPLVGRPERVRSVLDHRHARSGAPLVDRLVDGDAAHVHDDEGVDALGDGRLDGAEGDVEGGRVDVEQHRLRARVGEGEGARHERPDRHRNPSAGADAEPRRRGLERTGAGGHGHDVRHVEVGGQLLLERQALRARRQPPAAQHPLDRSDVLVVDVRRREQHRTRLLVHAVFHRWRGYRATDNRVVTPGSSSLVEAVEVTGQGRTP